jgi:hypothetical protein
VITAFSFGTSLTADNSNKQVEWIIVDKLSNILYYCIVSRKEFLKFNLKIIYNKLERKTND